MYSALVIFWEDVPKIIIAEEIFGRKIAVRREGEEGEKWCAAALGDQ